MAAVVTEAVFFKQQNVYYNTHTWQNVIAPLQILSLVVYVLVT